MLTVEKYGRIRRAHRDGMSIREIARQFHHSRSKVREVLCGGGEPQKYRRRETQNFPKLASVQDRIREILKVDEDAATSVGNTPHRERWITRTCIAIGSFRKPLPTFAIAWSSDTEFAAACVNLFACRSC